MAFPGAGWTRRPHAPGLVAFPELKSLAAAPGALPVATAVPQASEPEALDASTAGALVSPEAPRTRRRAESAGDTEALRPRTTSDFAQPLSRGSFMLLPRRPSLF